MPQLEIEVFNIPVNPVCGLERKTEIRALCMGTPLALQLQNLQLHAQREKQ